MSEMDGATRAPENNESNEDGHNENENDLIDESLQRMDDIQPSQPLSQQSMPCSQHSSHASSQQSSRKRALTPEFQRPASRLASIALSDSGALYGPEDDHAMHSQNSMDSHHSGSSLFADRRSEAAGEIGLSQPSDMGDGGVRGRGAHPMNRLRPDSIYDSQRFPFPMRRYWHPEGLLVCPDRHREYLYSQAKSMGLAINTEKSEAYGITWSLVFPFDGFGLPADMAKAVHFFTVVEALSTHHKWNQCVVTTCNLERNLRPNYDLKNKDIHGVLEATCTDDADLNQPSVNGPVDLLSLLQASESSSSGMVFRALPLLRMNIGITGALYKENGKEKRKLFGILYVHWLLNVDFMQLLLKTILAVPHVRTSNFDSVNKARNTLFDTFIKLLVSQSYGVTGGSPLDFLENPTGSLGAHNLCHPFWEPFKIVKALGKDASDVKIIGYPHIDWQGDPSDPVHGTDLRNYIDFANGYTGHMVEWCLTIQKACSETPSSSNGNPSKKRRNAAGSKEPVEAEEPEKSQEVSLPVFFGFPLGLGSSTRFYECISTFAPIFLDIRYLKVPNAKESYDCFQVNFGGIPMILQCLFRAFLFGRAGIDSARLDRIYLEDLDVKWNLSMLEERFYNTECRDAFQFASAGCNMKSYRDLVSYIKTGVKDGSVSPYNAVQIINRHFELCWGLYVAMVNAGSFMSDTVTQSLRMLRKLYVPNANGDIQFQSTLNSFLSRILPDTPTDFLLNPYDLAKRVILASFVNTNNAGQLLNSINLGTKLDLFITMVCYTMGSDNKTLTPFGKGIEIAPCNGSARMLFPGSKGIFVIKVGNPNGCGKDFAIIKVNADLDALCELLKESENKQKINIENKFTETAMLLRTCLQMVDGNVISTPDRTTNGKFTALTEVRGNMDDQLHILISYVYTRGDKTEQISTTTKEDPNSKARELVNRIKVSDAAIVARCTNCELTPKTKEAYETLAAVIHFRPSGAAIYTPIDPKKKDIASDYINRFECRSRRLSDDDAKISAFVHTAAALAAEQVGRMNQTMFPAEINPAVIGVLDWLMYVVQSNWESMFNLMCVGRRLNRLKRVYESRSAAMGLYTHAMQSLIRYDDCEEAIYKAAIAFHCDPLPLTNCGDLLYTLIYRSLSWVPIVYARCYSIETNMPVVPINILIQLFTAEHVPPDNGSELRYWYDEIAGWLTQCVAHHRFCINPEGSSFSEYISSSGTISGTVLEDGVLRVAKDQNMWLDADSMMVPKLLAECLWTKYGQELEHTFALSEPSMAACVDEMLKTFEVKGSKLLGFDVGNVERYAEFFGLSAQLPFKGRRFSNMKRPFAVQHAWMKDDSRDSKASNSVGIGLHWTQLLLLVSLTGNSIGDKLHPQFISDLSRTLVTLVLAQSPAAVTPGRFVEISSFNCYDCSLEPIDMGAYTDRPEHFLRPQNEQLAIDGVLPDCPNFQNFAVEDILPIGSLCGWSAYIDCPVWEVPAIADVMYNLRINVCYIVYNQTTGALGALEISNASVVTLEYDGVAGDNISVAFDLTTWQSQLMEKGFIVLPSITRHGAGVAINDEGGVGCLVRATEDGGSFNISRENRCYKIKVHVDTVQNIKPLDVMKKLLPIGALCYLKLECQSAGPLIRRLSMPLSMDERRERVLKIRLSSPNVRHPVDGKLYVVFVVRKSSVASSETIAVDPWEITTDKGRRRVVEHLSP